MNPGLNKIALLASADLHSAEVALRKIPNDDPGGCFSELVVSKIKAGTYRLCEIKDDEQQLGFTVFFVEQTPGNNEFVSVSTYCHPGKVLRFEIEDLLIRLAKSFNCQTMRMHTVRHGLISSALKCGWHTAEIVLRKSIA